MTREQRIEAFVKLGNWMNDTDENLENFIKTLYVKNAWYTAENVQKQCHAIAQTLTKQKLGSWLAPYMDFETDKSVGLILAGNLPLVGFHDILSTLILGFKAKIKTSSDDAGLTPYILNKLIQFEPAFAEKIEISEKLENFDLVIATGSNNSARYFNYYFGKKPNIIRKNRNSAAVLTGNESREELARLGNDIFDYFGLGCRSVSKIYFPKGYDVHLFFEVIEEKNNISNHFKYVNNYDYNKSIYLINKNKHFDNGFLLLKEDRTLASPLAVLYYEEYEHIQEVCDKINQEKDNLQCVVSSTQLAIDVPLFPLGKSQRPDLDDYADGINILDFLYENR